MLINLRNIALAFSAQPLLLGLDLSITDGERVALVGRNGSGKSTLMRVIAGEVTADDGVVERRIGLRVSRLEQEVPPDLAGTLYEVVADGLGDLGKAVARFHSLSERLARGEPVADAMTRAQAVLDSTGGWNLGPRIDAAISRLQLPATARFEALSGGQKRRVLLARALAHEPDLLLLDEPTNHLDIEAIAQLEEMLLAWPGALLFVTHDRAFLRRLATRIVDLDRGQLSSWPGDYDRYLSGQAKALEDEARANALFDKRLAQEEVWIRQGIKARRTRNEGRVRALQRRREERRARRDRQGVANMATQAAPRSGRQVILAQGVNFGWDTTPVVRDFSTLIERGDKIGIIGANGCGKTTLIQLLLGTLPPQTGTVKLGTNLQVAHFDQHRAALDLQATVTDNVGQGRSAVEINGQSKHIIGYLQDFLFTPERARSPARMLSGGERNRLLLAKLFAQPANLLVMDEPTNDLDVETLELLEDRLIDYSGTLLLVSHDRAFLDNVVTSTLVFEGAGHILEYVGGYSDWLRHTTPHALQRVADRSPLGQRPAVATTAPRPEFKQARRSDIETRRESVRAPMNLTPEQRKELRQLPGRIVALETEITTLQKAFAVPDYYQRDAATIVAAGRRLAAAEAELQVAFERWESLENTASRVDSP